MSATARRFLITPVRRQPAKQASVTVWTGRVVRFPAGCGLNLKCAPTLAAGVADTEASHEVAGEVGAGGPLPLSPYRARWR